MMFARVTRASASKAPSSLHSDKENTQQQPSHPPQKPTSAKNKARAVRKPTAQKGKTSKREEDVNTVEGSTKSESKRTKTSVETAEEVAPEVKQEDGTEKPLEAVDENSEPLVPNVEVKNERSQQPANIGKKRKRNVAPKIEEDPDELPHNMGKRAPPRAKTDGGPEEGKPSPKKIKVQKPTEQEKVEDAKDIIKGAAKPVQRKGKKKSNPYGLTPGETPFPDWSHPTREECQVVHDLLLGTVEPQRRSKFIQPDTIPPPSEQVAGCGEVPTILDAVIRTVLSAATSGRNSSNAFQGLVKRFGLQTVGKGKGSVNWEAVRLAAEKDVHDAIECGGLAKNKSKNIKKILDMVHIENEERRATLKKEKDAGSELTVEKEAEWLILKDCVLTLDYYHTLSKDDAIYTFINYPGVGVKTAACVALFCMQRPCFAVDTHVFRLCQYLGWVPPEGSRGPKQANADRNTTFSHCEVMVPDELKYGLHQLFLEHGKNCPRCRAITGESSEGWEDANCVIEHLVKRLGKKKGGEDSAKKLAKMKKKMEAKESDGEDSSDLMQDDGPSTKKPAKKRTATGGNKATTTPKAKKTASQSPANSQKKPPSKVTKLKARTPNKGAKGKKVPDEEEDEELSDPPTSDLSDLTDAVEPDSEEDEEDGTDE